MRHAVVEMVAGSPNVTLHADEAAATAYAVGLAKENTECDEEEIREHLDQQGSHEEGDWEVHVVEAKDLAAS